MKVLYLFVLFFFVSCNTALDKIRCIIENEKIVEQATKVVESFKTKDFEKILAQVFETYMAIKDDVKECLIDEPVLSIGCRFEIQFKECKLFSCDYMDEYECMEYCYRKYC